MIKPRRIVTGNDKNGESEIKINTIIEPDIMNESYTHLRDHETDSKLV